MYYPCRQALIRWSAVITVLLALTVPCAASHTFQLDTTQWNDQPRSVHVAGPFNGWNKQSHAMRQVEDRMWAIEIDLPDGVHLYKFVIDGERWINDPVYSDTELEESDGHGGVNSAVLIGKDARTLPAPRENDVRADQVQHDPAEDLRVIADGEIFILEVTTQAGDVQAVAALVTRGTHEPGGVRYDLSHVQTHLGLDTYRGMVRVDEPAVQYLIEVRDGAEAVVFGATDYAAADAAMPPQPFTATISTDVDTPDWARDAVWYQVFPERFRNGEPSNDPGDADYENLLPWTADWWETHTEYGEAPGAENFYTGAGNVWQRRFGGDLQGVQEALPYLRRLGINAIYFNPVFEADSMHKYDATDYRHIDDNFGVKSATPAQQVPGETDDPATWQWSESDKVFLAFLEAAHKQGFKVIIDGVFNHVGRSHPFFQDVLVNGKDSPYADWFEITDWGDPGNWRAMDDPMRVHGRPGGIQWVAWDEPNGHLPTFRKDDELGLAPGPRQHIFDITRRWLAPDGDPSRGIDGWRLDVPGDIPHPFWRDWRGVVKDTKPDAYITGEIWHFAHPWLKGDQFDATMNYPFAMAAQDFFVDQQTAITPSQFAQRLDEVAYAYPLQVALVQQNLFDSHDTDRVASMFVNPDRGYDGQNRIQDSGPDYDPRKPNDTEWKRLEQAVTFQMTFLGAPMIYYGTEAGMWGPDDPSDRMPMIWEDLLPYADSSIEFRRPLFEHYQKLIAIRDALPALRQGLFRTVMTDDAAGLIVYERSLDGQHVYVALNRSSKSIQALFPVAESDEGAGWIDLLRPDQTRVIAPGDDDAGDTRPKISLIPNAQQLTVENGRLRVTLPAYGSAILVQSTNLP